MPTYDFRCPNGHDFEKFFQKMSDAPSTFPCPECGAEAERRISGGAGLMFKGSGFYLTDYGKNAHRKSEPSKPASGEGSKTESKSESKSESKPAESKPAPKPASND